MKIRSLEQLNQRLTEDLIWRKKEISDLKSLIETRSFSPSKHNALLRSGVMLLYAHWEGYIKTAATSYLGFVVRQQLAYKDLAINFVAIAMKTKLNEANETNKATIFTEVTDFMLNQMNQKSSIPYEDVVSTASNLTSSILREIVCLLGLDYSFYETKEVIINEQLLKRRNGIAHGEHLSLDREEYQQLHDEILAMMENFRTQIENNASQKLYLRNP
ncbi:MAG: MAE_28990/MAE_18760 family HEPN-like nuclease [Xenococcaceae cyanobacterium]